MNTLGVSTPRWMTGAITSSVEGAHTVNSYVKDGFIEVNSHYFQKKNTDEEAKQRIKLPSTALEKCLPCSQLKKYQVTMCDIEVYETTLSRQ